MTSRQRVILYAIPWIVLLVPLSVAAPRSFFMFPAALAFPFGPSPESVPFYAAAGWALYGVHGWITLTRTRRGTFYFFYGLFFVILACDVAGFAVSLFALRGLH
jgi:hypothetical protein